MTPRNHEKLHVKVGIGALPDPLTKGQARRWGDAHMPADLKRAGFKTDVFESDPEIHGSRFLRVSYCYAYGSKPS